MSLGRMFQWSNGLNKAPEAAFVGMTGIEGFTPTKYFLLILLHGTWSSPETSGRAKQLVVENEKSKAIDRGHGRFDKYLDQSHLFCQIMQLKITEKPRMVWALEVFDPENGDFSSHWQMVKRLKAKVLKLVAFPNFRRFPRYLHLKSMNVLVSQPVELTTTFTGWLGCESWLEAWQHLRINLKPDKGALKHDESLCNNVISIVF